MDAAVCWRIFQMTGAPEYYVLYRHMMPEEPPGEA